MKKTIKITDVILFSIAGVIDLFEEMKDSGNLFSNYYQNYMVSFLKIGKNKI